MQLLRIARPWQWLPALALAAAGFLAGQHWSIPRGHGAAPAPTVGSAPAAQSQPGRLPTVHLLIGPGTLPSRGIDRLDFLRYGFWASGNAPMTGQELLEAVPEIAGVAQVVVDGGNPWSF